jgi:hypothetical protein
MTDLFLAAEAAPAPPRKVPRRPYAHLSKRERSVTEIIDRKKIEGLPWAAAKLTAEQAVYERDSWAGMNDEQAVDHLRRHFQGVWDGRAALGTAVHEVMDAWARAEDVDLWQVVCDLAESDPKAKRWQGHEAEVFEALGPYVEGLAQWFTDFEPDCGASEQVVRTPGVYIGQRDLAYVRVKGRSGLGLIDAKSTSQSEPHKGIYVDSWTLQTNGYDKAEQIVEYRIDPQGRIVEHSTRPNERHDWLAIVHLRGVPVASGRLYEMFEIESSDWHHRAFLDLARFNTWALLMDDAEPRRMEP